MLQKFYVNSFKLANDRLWRFVIFLRSRLDGVSKYERKKFVNNVRIFATETQLAVELSPRSHFNYELSVVWVCCFAFSIYAKLFIAFCYSTSPFVVRELMRALAVTESSDNCATREKDPDIYSGNSFRKLTDIHLAWFLWHSFLKKSRTRYLPIWNSNCSLSGTLCLRRCKCTVDFRATNRSLSVADKNSD